MNNEFEKGNQKEVKISSLKDSVVQAISEQINPVIFKLFTDRLREYQGNWLETDYFNEFL